MSRRFPALTDLRKPVVFRSTSASETESLGRRIARILQPPCVVLLRGALGTGKTTLARGIATGLGLRQRDAVNSPSFTLVNVYHGKCKIYHVDLYRLEGDRDLYSIGLDEFLGRDGVTIVEWAERLRPTDTRAICIDLEDAGGDRRTIAVSCSAPDETPHRQGRRDRPRGGTLQQDAPRGRWRDKS